ncbi:MAG: hypothetical protein R3176_04140 [Woeseiaceae bacterium]|nr:hypothetical protein [Woeseiaceae bacterium]
MQRPAETKGKTARRRFPAVPALLLLCLGLQPCMVAAAADGGCPHGAEAHAMPADHAHGHGHAPAAPDCDSAAASCCNLEASAAGSRTATPKADDGGEPQVLPAPAPFDSARRQPGPPARYDKPPLPPDRQRPLHVLNCVYLD